MFLSVCERSFGQKVRKDEIIMKVVNTREVWRREDEDFSPWLVENLNLLDEILGTKLELIGREKPVGRFFADILCVNRKSNNALVVVENQLGQSDHDHLGKLLTYAAGLQATTVIWIATAFDDQHRSALAWLNHNMNNLVQCYGVKLELKPIDNSTCLPTFTLVAEPYVGTQQRINDHLSTSHNEAQQRTNDRPPTTNGNPVKSSYWSAFREFWNKTDSKIIPHERNSKNYFGFHIGNRKDFWFAAWRNDLETQIAAKLCMHSTDNFDPLNAQQRAIASEIRGLSEHLEWDRSPRYGPYPQVGFYKRGLPKGDRSDWQNQFEWLLTAFNELDRVFGARIAELVSSQH